MAILHTSPFLRMVLLLDAAVSGAMGVLMASLSSRLAELLQLPASLLFYAGLFLLPYAALLVYLSQRASVPRWTVWAVVLGNVAWAVDCILLPLTGWVAPSTLGYTFIAAHVVAVLAFAELQYLGMRRSMAVPAH